MFTKKENTTKKEKTERFRSDGTPVKMGGRVSVPGIIAVIVVLFLAFFVLLVPINPRSEELWVTAIVAAIFYIVADLMEGLTKSANREEVVEKSKKKALVPIGLIVLLIVLNVSGAAIFHAKGYASILKVQEVEFSQDLNESVGTDSIALMDTASAKKLGDREIGSLSNVVSQYDVSEEYTQIDFQGKPKKVAALDYVGFFKWINNKKQGIPGYVTVDPVTMSANYKQSEAGMIYVPSAYLMQDAARHIYLSYPTTLWGNLHFEIDEEGNPYYIASVYKKKISIFGGTTADGCIVMDPITGAMNKYALAEVPTWVDMVFSGDLICQQYNWYGNLSNGFMNSVIGKKGCKQVTTYYSGGEEAPEDAPTSDYGYVSKDGDIWIYTGVTSVNNDSSNIGFLLANERTGESHYFSISGADEKSAMSAAEGEVQEKRYQASFPSLINVDGNPTYIMVLKDNSGLVKLYAAVNVEQYNLVTTAASQKECLNKYRTLLGIAENSGDASNIDSSALEETEVEEEQTPAVAAGELDLSIADIKYIDIDGNTYIYLISADSKLYKGMAKEHEEMLLLKAGDQVHISYTAENEIISCEMK